MCTFFHIGPCPICLHGVGGIIAYNPASQQGEIEMSFFGRRHVIHLYCTVDGTRAKNIWKHGELFAFCFEKLTHSHVIELFSLIWDVTRVGLWFSAVILFLARVLVTCHVVVAAGDGTDCSCYLLKIRALRYKKVAFNCVFLYETRARSIFFLKSPDFSAENALFVCTFPPHTLIAALQNHMAHFRWYAICCLRFIIPALVNSGSSLIAVHTSGLQHVNWDV